MSWTEGAGRGECFQGGASISNIQLKGKEKQFEISLEQFICIVEILCMYLCLFY